MYPVIEIGSVHIPTYGLLTVIGFCFAIILFMHRARGRHIEICDVLYSAIYAAVGIIAGSKLLYLITTLPGVLMNFGLFLEHPWDSLVYMFSGYVFYGGLIGGAVAFCIYCRKYKLPLEDFIDSVMPSVPLFHIFGRIGCLFAGCCYGIEYHGIFRVTFPHNNITADIAGVPRFPTQICEAVYNLLLVVILILYSRKPRKAYSIAGLYLVFYSLFRFFIEFVRGDMARGGLWIFSTSQWISMGLFVFGWVLILRKQKKGSRKAPIWG